MTKGFFLKLAASNIKKNSKTYIPYILTCIMTVTMFYIVKSLSLNPSLKNMVGMEVLFYMLFLGSWIIALFALIFLFYTNSFLMKRRKKEFAVFHILGMEKRHLFQILCWETIYVTLISLTAGLILGITLDKVMFLAIIKMLEADIPLGFFISWKAIGATILLFIGIFFLIFLYSVKQIHEAKPIDLLHAGNVGEKEPKTNWLLAILGIVCLSIGYYIAITTKNPVASLMMFFVAVILVIIGTYMVFTAGSVAFLKVLRKNKKYYYQTRHFISVSGMIYRMKQNAVGLANICILSTMVLIMISSTTSLMIGMEDIIQVRYPNDFTIYSSEKEESRSEESFEAVRKLQREQNLNITQEVQYTYLSLLAMQDKNTFYTDYDATLTSVDSIISLFFVPLSDYNAMMGEHKILNKGEIMINSNQQLFHYQTLNLLGREYQVVEHLDDMLGNGILSANISTTLFIVVSDREELNALYTLQKGRSIDIRQFYGFDTDLDEEKQMEFYRAMRAMFKEYDYKGTIESKVQSRQSFMGFYGGFFFIGIFLGVLFIMATVLIIYYKQISEGYDDRERFIIMQKVGMSRNEVKASIHSQILTVFFLPLLVAGIHVIAAFPLISKILALFNLLNTKLYVACTAVCFLVFALMYVFIYQLTAKTYYHIVSR